MSARRFVVLAQPRTGSTMLCERLNSHPCIACFGEVLQPTGPVWDPALRPANAPPSGIARTDPASFLENGVWGEGSPEAAAIGTKILFVHYATARVNLEPYFTQMTDLWTIWLRRENLLAQYVSHRHARRTGHWILRDGDAPPELPPLEIDPDDLHAFFRTAELQELAVARGFQGHPALRLTYEELISDPDLDRRLCDFLGVEARALSHTSVRMAQRSLREAIVDFDDLARWFDDTPFSGYFR